MDSRLLARLDAALAASKDVVDKACLRAERAAFIARQGHLADAQAEIDKLHRVFDTHAVARLSAWLHFAQAMHGLYALGGGRDALQRAHALSRAAHVPRLSALCAAWQAQFDYAAHALPAMVEHLVDALTTINVEDHAVSARAHLVLACALHYAGRLDLAQPWYTSARVHALADGDEAALSALLHNQAGIRGTESRLEVLFGGAEPSHQALLGAESAAHYDAGVGTASLAAWVPMLRAPLLVSEGAYAQALQLYELHFDTAMAQGLARQRACFVADMAWCRFQLGQIDDLQEQIAQVQAALLQDCDVDDRAWAQARMAQLWRALGDEGLAAQAQAQAWAHVASHRIEQQRVLALLDARLSEGLRTRPC